MMKRRTIAVAALLLSAACTASSLPAGSGLDAGSSGSSGSSGAPSSPDASTLDAQDAAVTPRSGADCSISTASSLPGVTLRFTGSVCTFTLAQAAAGLSIPYELVVDHDIPGTYPHRQYSGNCNIPDPNVLAPFESLIGNGQQYALFEFGLPCFDAGANTEPPVTVTKGTFSGTFTWAGRNYGGPSDTNRQPGPPFPIGDYTLTVDATGTVDTSFGANDGGAGDAGGGVRTPYDVNAVSHLVLVP
jgi:hypothetical protein